MFKALGGFFLFIALIGTSLFAGYSAGKAEQSRAVQGCEVVADQAVQDKNDAEAGLYETIEYFQNRLFICDTILSNMEVP